MLQAVKTEVYVPVRHQVEDEELFDKKEEFKPKWEKCQVLLGPVNWVSCGDAHTLATVGCDERGEVWSTRVT